MAVPATPLTEILPSIEEARREEETPRRRVLLWPLLLLFGVTVLLVSPRDSFPLNDDWVYAKSVKWLIEEHRLAVHPYSAVNAIGQTLIGTAFSAPFGFDFTALRVSTLFLALLCAWAIARTGQELNLTRGMALLIASMVLWNPIFLNLAYTFMTDVPFAAFLALSLWFFVRAARNGRATDVFWGSSLAVYAFFIRQFSVMLPIAYLLTLLFVMGREGRRPSRAQWAALLVPWMVAGALLALWKVYGDTGYVWHAELAHRHWILRAIRFTLRTLRFPFLAGMYLGLFLLPLSLAKAWNLLTGRETWTRGQRRVFIAWSAGVIVIGTGFGYVSMPLMTNMLRDFGVGPLTLQDTYFDHTAWSPITLAPAAWWAVTILCLVSGGLIAADLWGRVIGPCLSRRPGIVSPPAHHVFLTLAGLLLAIAPCNPWMPNPFDRYFLSPAIPLALVYATGIRTPAAGRAVAWACAAGLYLFGLVCLQDYMAWNRARWTAVETLRRDYDAADAQIDGGYEFNGMYTSDEFMRRYATTDFYAGGKHRWWVLDNLYAVSFLPRPGYKTIETAPYRSWLGPHRRELLILRREPAE